MNEWRKEKLKNIVYINQNNFSKEDKWEYISYLDTANITDGVIENIQKLNLKKDSIPSRARRKVLKEDVIVSSVRPNLKHFGIIKKPKKNMIVSTGFIVLTAIKNIIDPYYLYNFFRKENIIEYLSSIAETSTTTYPSITSKVIEELEIKLPPLNIQKKISKILSDIDNKIELNNKINNNLEILIFLIYQKIFLNNNFSQRKLCKMEEYFNISIGKTPPRKNKECFSNNSNDNIWVSILDMKSSGIYIDKSSEYLTSEAIKKYNVKVIPKNTLLLSFKLTIGRIAITCQDRTTTNEAIAHFLTDKKGATEYLYCYLKNFNFNILGSTSSIATAINSKIIKEITFIIPEEDELNEFYNLVNPLFKKIRTFQLENIKLTNLKNYLLPKLMNGEIDVENIEL